MIDLVAMPTTVWGMKYLVLAREELSNFVKGMALGPKHLKMYVDSYLKTFSAGMEALGG